MSRSCFVPMKRDTTLSTIFSMSMLSGLDDPQAEPVADRLQIPIVAAAPRSAKPLGHRVRLLRSSSGAEGEFAGGAEGGDRFAGGKELHGDGTGEVELCECAEDIRVIDFAGAGFVAAGNVGDVNDGGEVDVFLQLVDQISLGDLLVVEVVKKLHVGAGHFADDLKALGDGR